MSQPDAGSHLGGSTLEEPQKFFIHVTSEDVDGEAVWCEGELVTSPVKTAEGSFAYATINGDLVRICMEDFEVQKVVARATTS